MRVEFDAERCVGHGRCYALAPELFDADDHGHALLLGGAAGDIADRCEDAVRAAVANCPEGALVIAEPITEP